MVKYFVAPGRVLSHPKKTFQPGEEFPLAELGLTKKDAERMIGEGNLVADEPAKKDEEK